MARSSRAVQEELEYFPKENILHVVIYGRQKVSYALCAHLGNSLNSSALFDAVTFWLLLKFYALIFLFWSLILPGLNKTFVLDFETRLRSPFGIFDTNSNSSNFYEETAT